MTVLICHVNCWRCLNGSSNCLDSAVKLLLSFFAAVDITGRLITAALAVRQDGVLPYTSPRKILATLTEQHIGAKHSKEHAFADAPGMRCGTMMHASTGFGNVARCGGDRSYL